MAPAPLAAQERPVLLRDSFPIGSAEGILCQVQDRSLENKARQSMFDRAWAVVCRDSAQPVSTVYAFKGDAGDPLGRIAPLRRQPVECPAGATVAAALDGVASHQLCRISGTELGWSIYSVQQGDVTYVADGFSAYDSATVLALRSVLENRIAPGVIDVATTSVSDPFAFARIQAATLEPSQAMAEGYRRNLGGEYAEAAAYFETLEQRLAGDEEADINPGEFLVNRALQKSNLGEFAEADRLFIKAEPLTSSDPVAARLQRNFEAIHLLNQGFYPEAITRLDRPITAGLPSAEAMAGRLEISAPIAARINGDGAGEGLLGFVDEVKLSKLERATIIDAQALQLKGTALRLSGNKDAARTALLDAYAQAISVRDGRVISIARLRSQVLGELALIAESEGDLATAESYLLNAIDILQAQYPDRRAVSGAKARLGAMLLRNGREEEGMAIYREIVSRAVGKGDAATGFSNQLAPYFRRLAPRVGTDGVAADDFFEATQILVRPGVAETQAILARELSARNDEAARLFRQSTDLTREIERARIRYVALGREEQTGPVRQAREELQGRIEEMEQQQQRTQAALAQYPQYRVVAPRSLSLGDFRSSLQPGEAYARLAVVGNSLFMFYTDKETALAWPVDVSAEDLELKVDLLRASISVFEGGQYLTYPYDIEGGHELYTLLFSPVADRLQGVKHLVFEPDGAMLRLPVDLLVTDDASVERYLQRIEAGGDAFDFTGVNWFGRGRMVSTAVSAQAFVDARMADRSSATQEYLGLGRNAPIGDSPPPAIAATLVSGGNACGWTTAEWNRPIDDAELVNAQSIIGGGRSQLITGANFSDSAILAKQDLDQYRVLHFATHGLVTAPRASCPARPALLTSFGGEGSDGLLSFQEIFDLDLDADIVILSACDTAGKASVEATREAGIASGGGTALDGLVRAFIGAGGRSVLASHWPAPDEFDATERLMNEMFRQGRNRDVGEALGASRRALMDQPNTSHPYYWAGFAIIGDAARPLLTDPAPATASAEPASRAGGGNSQARN
ncbi:MAG: CHAT domain-containing protein [Sphingomonadaceae bacterium]|nr:CHAT domain-containing protein [Sphingomonadaceae bacterium]